ncbi:MAG: flagellar biosynthesis protein FlhF [Spirochaetaceae bacterium]|nr:flagellar biosynthesis protein FlhF [Spirochaetaceae bacterium]
MQYFTEQAPSHREALDRVRAKYGEQAQILSHRTVRAGGILGLFAREAVEVTGYIRPEPRPAQRPPTDLEEEKRKILEKARSEQTRSDAALERVLTEIRDLKAAMDERPSRPSEAEDHESIARADELLAQNDFTEGFRRALVGAIRRDFTLEALEDWPEVEASLLEMIGDSVELWRERPARGPRVLALVGPTGVGKTTTIAKLAAIYAVGIGGEKPRSVRMITIDNYRIGARQQIETYGNIMGVPVSCVETAEDLKKTIALHADADVILVDTIGKSPRDAVRLAEMQRLVAACGPGVEVHLAVPATMKTSDIAETLRQFEPFGYRAVVLTKLDETNRVGNAISALAERRKPISYLTTGQRVPQDIERAEVTSLLTRLEGFRVDRARVEARYGEGPAAEGRGAARSNAASYANEGPSAARTE